MKRITILTALGCLALIAAKDGRIENSPETKNEGKPSVEVDVSKRFASPDVREVPDFQKHVAPLLGRLGCNARACHGSFQGRGGFQLSLFGYDFAADHKALLDGRVDMSDPEESLLLAKPTDGDDHGGGLKIEEGSWQYNLLKRWVEGEAPARRELAQIEGLEITPAEILVDQNLESVQLKVVAHWSDGEREDVTPLCRFQSNDTQIAKIDAEGQVTFGVEGDSHVVVFYDKSVVPVPVIKPVSDRVGANYPTIDTPTRIDQLTAKKWRKLGLVPSDLSDDATFLRRVHLDLTGTLPSPGETREFLADRDSDKRSRKIDELLETPAYAAWWTTRLCDITGNNSYQLRNNTPNNQASRQWYDWIRVRVENNTPYIDIVEGIVLATSREEGESYREYCEKMSEICRERSTDGFVELDSMPYYWMRRDFREPSAKAISFAHSFLGIRIQCAQCHKHPFDQWDKKDFQNFAQFFSGVNITRNGTSPADRRDMQQMLKDLGVSRLNGQARRTINQKFREGETIPFVQLAVGRPRPILSEEEKKDRRKRRGRNQSRDRGVYASVLGGDKVDISRMTDARTEVMDWLRDADNPYFARAFVNRVWANYFNVGIVEPSDDLNLANPPSNAELLDYLTRGFVENNYDMKWLHREITNSRTYQLSWKPNETNEADRKNFSRSIPRRLPAEQVFDALMMATSDDKTIERYDEELARRAIAEPGTARNRRSAGRGVLDALYAMSIFGRSTRMSSCDCDRSDSASLLQTVYIQNDRDIHTMIDREQAGWLSQLKREFGGGGVTEFESKRLERGEAALRNLRRRVRQAQRNRNSKQVRNLKKRIADLEKRVAPERKRIAKAKAASASKPPLDALIDDVYLRTLCRLPNDKERQRCRTFIEEDEDWINGMRGVFWALLNTKEFIVNH